MAADQNTPAPKYQIGDRIRPTNGGPSTITRVIIDDNVEEPVYEVEVSGGAGRIRESHIIELMPEVR